MATSGVVQNAEHNRFEFPVGEKKAVLLYRQEGDELTITHTEVPPEGAGKGIAGQLAQAALEYARINSLAVVPRCPYMASYLAKHKEYLDLVAPEWKEKVAETQ